MFEKCREWHAATDRRIEQLTSQLHSSQEEVRQLVQKNQHLRVLGENYWEGRRHAQDALDWLRADVRLIAQHLRSTAARCGADGGDPAQKLKLCGGAIDSVLQSLDRLARETDRCGASIEDIGDLDTRIIVPVECTDSCKVSICPSTTQGSTISTTDTLSTTDRLSTDRWSLLDRLSTVDSIEGVSPSGQHGRSTTDARAPSNSTAEILVTSAANLAAMPAPVKNEGADDDIHNKPSQDDDSQECLRNELEEWVYRTRVAEARI